MAHTPQQPIVVVREGPLLIVTFHGAATDEQYAAHLAVMTGHIEANKHKYRRLAVINDASRWLNSNAVQRKMQADWMIKHDAEMRHKTAGVAFVITSALVRGGLNAILWFAPLPCPHNVVATLGEARAWTAAALASDAVEPPQAQSR